MTFSTIGTDTTTKQPVQINKTVRPQGLYIVGRQGTGKSGLLENLIIQDIKQGLGVCVLDPHHQGGIIDNIIARIPPNREKDVILLDIRDNKYPFGLNLFACSDPQDDLEVQEVVDRVMHVFDKLLGVTPETPLIRQYLRNCTYTLVANPGFTMAEILLLLTDKHCRQKLVANVTDPQVSVFWKQYEAFSPNVQEERSSSLQRRVEEFLQRLTNNIVGQSTSTIDFRAIMDDSKILLVKLDSLRLSSVTNLIGSLFIAAFLTASSTRMRKQNIFNIYADEFQNFATEDFVKLIEEARKFGIGITIAHQNRAQLELSNKQAEIELKKRVLNVGSLIVFCVPTDAYELAGQFNITPQAAWEEELEPERIKVLRPQRHERVKEVIDDGVEEIKTPVAKPYDWLVAHTHPSPAVNRFMDERIRKFNTNLSTSGGIDRRDFNNFLYRAMTSSDPLSLLCEQSFIFQLRRFYRDNKIILNKEFIMSLDFRDYFEYTIFAHIDNSYSEDDMIITNIYSRVPRVSHPRTFPAAYKTDDVIDERAARAFNAMIRASEYQFAQACENFALVGNPKFEQILSNHLKYLGSYIQRLENEFQEFDRRFKDKSAEIQRIWKYDLELDIKRYKEARVNCQQRFLPSMKADRQRFETFIKEFRDFILALAKEPITIGSGLQQPRKRTQVNWLTHESEKITIPRKTILHPQRSYNDVKDELANQLVDLPDYVARVKIKGEPEHLIQTLDPKKQADKPLYGQLLDDRIERFKKQNRKAGYTRPRQDVEKEIRMRQDALRQAQQPQKVEIKRREEIKPQPIQPASTGSPIQHLSPDLQRKIDKRTEKQTVSHRSSGTSIPADTLALSPAELQKRYREYELDMKEMGRKPLSREAWEKLEQAKYAAENE